MVNNWLNIIQDSLLPPSCILCGGRCEQSRDLCQACHHELPRNRLCCYRCGEVFASTNAVPLLCGQCLKQRPAFDETHAPFLYQGAIRHLIQQLKYNASYKNARLLGSVLSEFLQSSAQMPDCIIPVPLHPSRYCSRGFNQAHEIARTVSKQLHVELALKSCQRHRNTQQQTTLSAIQRRKNLKNAFSICHSITAQHVAVLDDVMTTGTTADELAKTLKLAGVYRVDIWVCARA